MSETPVQSGALRTLLFGREAAVLEPALAKYARFALVSEEPDLVVCYGGDGTLLKAELAWPGVPKVPIRNSRRGHRCIPHPPEEVLARLAAGQLLRTTFMKLRCEIHRASNGSRVACGAAMNEFIVHHTRINAALRFRLWVNGEAIEQGREIVGDGFLVSTPFGSTAYFKQITRGVFYSGIGIAFTLTPANVNHLIVAEDSTIRARLTRGLAQLAHDNADDYFDMAEGDELTITPDPLPATVLTWDTMLHPSDAF